MKTRAKTGTKGEKKDICGSSLPDIVDQTVKVLALRSDPSNLKRWK
jgi:hypothetical protein